MAGCLGDDTIAAYVDGALAVDELGRVDRHIDGCAACRGQLSAMAATMVRSFVTDVGQELDETTVPRVPTADLAPGASLGRYVIAGILGRGGMGVVVRAYDPELARHVAIKLVDPSLAHGTTASGEWRKRLRTEARAMARLRHPNVIAVHDAGSIGERLFVAMELVDGESLGRWLEGHGRADALSLCIAAGRGLCAAHAAGLVHGDVKPDNILVGRDGRAMIGDFGLARVAADGATEDGHVLCGTPAYMAPELFRGEPADQRSDQLAFAVTLFEALTGARPWRGDSLAALCAAISSGPPGRPATVPSWLWPVLVRGLAAEPAARHPSMASFVDALERAARRRRRRGPIVAAATVAALGAGIAVVAWPGARARSVACPDPAARTRPLADRVRGVCAAGGADTPACTRLIAAVEARLDGWRITHRAVCTATREGRQSAELLDARMRCLDQRLVEHDALLGQLGRATPAAPELLDAIVAVDRLPDPVLCERSERGGGALPPPGHAEEIARAEATIADALAAHALGHYQTGLALLAPHEDAIVALASPPLTAQLSRLMALLLREIGRLDEAEARLDRGRRAAALAGDDATGAQLMLDLAELVTSWRADPTRGAELLRAADAAVVRAGSPPGLESSYLILRGGIAEGRGDLAAAATDFTRAVELRRDAEGVATPDVAVALQRLCSVESQLGRRDDARGHCERALTILQTALGPDHPAAASAENELGVTIAIEGDLPAARARWQRSLASFERSVGPTSPMLVPVLLNLADVSGMLGDPAAASAHLDRALQLAGAAPDDRANLEVRLRVARNLHARGDLAAATTMFDELARRAEVVLGAHHPTTASALAALAATLYQSDRLDDARRAFERAIAAYTAINGPRHDVTLSLEGQLGQTLMAQGELAQACALFERVMLALEAASDPRSPVLAQAYINLADCRLAIDQPAQTVELAERALPIFEAHDEYPVQLAETRWILGQALWRTHGDRQRAVALVVQARDDMRAIGPDASSLPRVERWLASTRAR